MFFFYSRKIPHRIDKARCLATCWWWSRISSYRQDSWLSHTFISILAILLKKNKTNKSETETEKRGKILKDKPESLRYCCHLAFFCLVNCAVQLKDNSVDWPEQMTPTSSPWPQLLVPKGLWVHWKMDISSPLHCTSSSQMSPCPSPKKADALAARAAPHCSSLHATLALARPQLSSHTVPHLLL